MIDRRELLLLSGAAAASVTSSAQTAPASAAARASRASRASEVRALRRFAETTHPRGRAARDDADWQRRWASLERAADTLSDGAYFIQLRRAVGWFGDGHSTPLPFEVTGGPPEALKRGPFGRHLPVKIQLFHDAAIVTAATEAHRDLLGASIDRIGTFETAALIREVARDWPGNRAWAHRWAGFSLTSPAHLQGLGAISDPARPVRLVSNGKWVELETLTAAPRYVEANHARTHAEDWAADAKRGNYVLPARQQQAVYVSIDDMADVDGATFERLTRDAFAAFELDWPNRIVIDLRRNGGGNNFLAEALRKRIEASRFNRPGGLYVLIGPQTFSAAQNFANRIERETFAIFAGEPTGGAPNHFGDAEPFVGPATKITTIVSTLPWFDSYPQDERPWILPDLPAPVTSGDWLEGRDRALDLAFSHQTSAPADQWSRDRVFYYERQSQKAEWKPFWA